MNVCSRIDQSINRRCNLLSWVGGLYRQAGHNGIWGDVCEEIIFVYDLHRILYNTCPGVALGVLLDRKYECDEHEAFLSD